MISLTNLAKNLAPVDALMRRPPGLYRRMRAEVAEADTLSPGERRARQAERLARILEAAATAPYYASKHVSGGLEGFPLLGKQDVRAHGEAMRPNTMRIAARAVTSGSTGVPLVLWRSTASIVYEQATVDHLIAKTGFCPLSARVLMLRADTFKAPDDAAPPYWRSAGMRKAALSAQHLNRETFPAYVDFIRTFRPDFLFAYAASLDLLLRYIADSGTRLQIPLVLTSCEKPACDLRARARALIGAEMLDYYGQAERTACAYALEDGKYWFRPDYGAVELVSGPHGYEVVATALRNSAQYLVRYRTGDIAETGTTDPAELERIALGVAPFAGISGRTNEYLQLADGSRVVGLNHIVRDVKGIASAQIVQKDFDAIELVVVPDAGFGPDTLATLKDRIARKIPSRVSYVIRTADTPCRTAAGKAPLFLSEMEPTP